MEANGEITGVHGDIENSLSVLNKVGVWYMFYVSECVICGKTTVTRERRHSPKPECFTDRYEFSTDSECASYDVAVG